MESVLSLWEEYLAWCGERDELSCAPHDFFHELVEQGIQVSSDYAYGLSLKTGARRRMSEWQYTPLSPRTLSVS
jgi:hypothetical protein